jgi:hypothetical protein
MSEDKACLRLVLSVSFYSALNQDTSVEDVNEGGDRKDVCIGGEGGVFVQRRHIQPGNEYTFCSITRSTAVMKSAWG